MTELRHRGTQLAAAAAAAAARRLQNHGFGKQNHGFGPSGEKRGAKTIPFLRGQKAKTQQNLSKNSAKTHSRFEWELTTRSDGCGESERVSDCLCQKLEEPVEQSNVAKNHQEK